MNLRLIEKRFQNLETRANYLNYKYNPNCQKVSGIAQHAYMDDLKTDYLSDMKVFGQDPFHTKKIDNSRLASAKDEAALSLSFNSSAVNMYNFDKLSGGFDSSPGRPYTTQTVQSGAVKKRRYQPYSSQGAGFGMPRRNIQSQQVLARRLGGGGTSDAAMSQQVQHKTDEAPHIMDQAVKRELVLKRQMQQKTLQKAAESREQFANQRAHLEKSSKPQKFSKNINQIMESLIKFKLPEQMFEVIKQHQDPKNGNVGLSERLSDVQSLNDLMYKREAPQDKSQLNRASSRRTEVNLDLTTAKLNQSLPTGSKQLGAGRDQAGANRIQPNSRHAPNMSLITPQKMSPRFNSQGRFLSKTFGHAHVFGQGVKSISALLATEDCVNPNTMVLKPRTGEPGDVSNILTNEKIVLQNDLSQQTLAQQSRQVASGSGNDDAQESVRKHMRMMQNGNDTAVKVAAQVPTKTLEETSMNSPVSPLSQDAHQLQDTEEGQATGSLRNARATVINTKGIAESAECTARMDGELNVMMPQGRKTTRNPNNELFSTNAISQNRIEIKNSRKAGAGAPQRVEQDQLGARAAEAFGQVSVQPANESAAAAAPAIQAPQTLTDIPPPSYKNLLFNLKITDVGDLSNPFVVFEKRPINAEGVLFLHDSLMYLTPEQQKNLNINPCHIFPWLGRPQELERRTLKIEVIYSNELILSRYLHLNKLYPVEYPKLALQISNNIYQNQYLLYKEKKVSSLLQRSSKRSEKGNTEPDSALCGVVDGSREAESPGGNSNTRAPHLIQKAQIVEQEAILVFDGVSNVSIQPDECMIRVQRVQADAQAQNAAHGFLVPHFFTINPAKDRSHRLLEQLRHHDVALKDLKSHIVAQSQHSEAALPKEALLKFPQFSKMPQKIVIEFQDSVIQGLDLMDFHILVDDDQDRIQALVDYENDQRPSLGQSYPVRGCQMNQGNKKDKSNEKTHAALNSYNVVFGQERQLNEGAQQLNKQIAMAQQNKGLNVLIRKHNGQMAAENRKAVSRKPLGPNGSLVGASEFSGAICAAEMSDKGQIFKHLINTSLLTAPLFPDPQMGEQYSHLLSPIDEIFSQPPSHSASAFKKLLKNSQMSTGQYQPTDPRDENPKPNHAQLASNTRSLQTSPDFHFRSDDRAAPETQNITKPQYSNQLSMNRNSDIARPELVADFGAQGRVQAQLPGILPYEHVASFGNIKVLRNNTQFQNTANSEAPGNGPAARAPGQMAETRAEVDQGQPRGDAERPANVHDSSNRSHLNSTKKLANFDRAGFGSQHLQHCELGESQHAGASQERIQESEGLGLRAGAKKQNSETVHYMKIDGGSTFKGHGFVRNDINEEGFERQSAAQRQIVAEIHNSLDVNKGKERLGSITKAAGSGKGTEKSRQSVDGRGEVERRVSIASSGLGNYKLSAREGEQAQDAATAQPALPKKKVSYSKDSLKQQDLGAIAQHTASQKANQLNAGGWMKQSGQTKQCDLATNQLNDHFNIQNAGARYSQENALNGKRLSQQDKGLELTASQQESGHQPPLKPILSGHHLKATGLQGAHRGSLEQIQQPTTFIKVLGEGGQVAYNGGTAQGPGALNQLLPQRQDTNGSQLNIHNQQSILRNNSNHSGLSGPSHLAGTIHREQRDASQLSNAVTRPALQPSAVSADAFGAPPAAGLSSNSSLSPLGPKPAPKMASQYGANKQLRPAAPGATNQHLQDADKYSPAYFASAEAMAKLKGIAPNDRK